jgi:hypothetical protein
MRIGMLGDIIFEVSDDVVRTINNAQWSGSARYATHQRHLTNAKTEFAGINPDQMKFDIVLSAYLGVNPQAEITKIWQYERSGRTLPLVIGRKGYGKFRWTITQHQIKLQHYDGEGDLTQATVTVNLQEYLNR